MCVLFYFYFVCLHVCAYAFNGIRTYTLRALLQGPLRDCPRAGHFRASLLLHTTCVRSCCTWIGALAVWRQNIEKKFVDQHWTTFDLDPLFRGNSIVTRVMFLNIYIYLCIIYVYTYVSSCCRIGRVYQSSWLPTSPTRWSTYVTLAMYVRRHAHAYRHTIWRNIYIYK